MAGQSRSKKRWQLSWMATFVTAVVRWVEA